MNQQVKMQLLEAGQDLVAALEYLTLNDEPDHPATKTAHKAISNWAKALKTHQNQTARSKRERVKK